MAIDTLIIGAYETNCYILRKSPSSKDCVVIDTGLKSGQLIPFLKKNALNPAAIILTHGHADHIGGLEELKRNFPKIKPISIRLTLKCLPIPTSIFPS